MIKENEREREITFFVEIIIVERQTAGVVVEKSCSYFITLLYTTAASNAN